MSVHSHSLTCVPGCKLTEPPTTVNSLPTIGGLAQAYLDALETQRVAEAAEAPVRAAANARRAETYDATEALRTALGTSLDDPLLLVARCLTEIARLRAEGAAP